MAGKSSSRRRQERIEKLGRMHIATQLPVRTLKRSGRKQLQRERAPHLWIYPGLENPAYAATMIHPRASLLGLPIELRQRILHKTLEMEELEVAAAQETATEEEKQNELIAIRTLREDWLTSVAFTTREIKLLKAFSRHTVLLCSISPSVRKDMRWVRGRLRLDLISHMDSKRKRRTDVPHLPTVAAGHAFLAQRSLHTYAIPTKKGKTIQGRIKRGSEKKSRPPKCWACMERHTTGDPKCPMERREPERWLAITKRVGGRRVEKQESLMGTKVVFDD
ncbi:hypothetical protein T440DRAFT_444062 [Plenodomus tracheiphilus IPT5]|uniref:Uncharacterized protein n=1 Tax=Plenodomus tracheiphilus IPT5 TaxID=1408161 RepID=A0A6A7BFG9_9PLEO|nr:hypothetical protein T440DRAFT_444062 [Plenodomus tracheiphilus IPT5]